MSTLSKIIIIVVLLTYAIIPVATQAIAPYWTWTPVILLFPVVAILIAISLFVYNKGR